MQNDKKGLGLLQQAIRSCRVCSLEPECLGWNLGAEELRQLEGIVRQLPPRSRWTSIVSYR